MAWAEKDLDATAKYPHQVNDARNLAAAELFRLTGEQRWNDLFAATTVFKKPGQDLFVWQDHEQRDAPWVYVRTDRPGRDPDLVANCRAAILKEADDRAANCLKTGFRWTKFEWNPASFGALSAPDGVSLVRAHILTGDKRYLRTLVLACQEGAGANPVNICYTTGVGHAWPQHPLNIDSRITHQSPPPGLTVAGPADVQNDKDNWAQKIVAGYCYPDVQQWPTMEAYWDVFWYPSICEYTVQSPMAQNAYVWGYLAAR